MAQQTLLPTANDGAQNMVPIIEDATSSQQAEFFSQTNNMSQIPTASKDVMGFEGMEQIDLDTDLWFKLRGNSLNPLIDAATPLFGLILRVGDIQQYAGIQKLYSRVHGDIAAIDEEVRNLGYDSTAQLSFRYCLCSFVDEAVMATSWGAQSIWAEHSMLSVYHKETWGGEKFFTIVSRMMMEPEAHKEMLEFLYLCLALGFKGKYGVMPDGSQQLNQLISNLHHLLREQRGDSPDKLIETGENIYAKQYRIRRQIPLWSIWASLAAVLSVVYFFYATSLADVTEDVLKQLDLILIR
jgi:type VI secretion system protein ImpK